MAASLETSPDPRKWLMPPSGSTNRFLADFSGASLAVAVLASPTRYRFGNEPWEKGQNRAGDSHGSVNLHVCRIQVVWDDPEALDGASDPPDAPFCQPIPWTRAFGSSPIRAQEARARSPTARSTLIPETLVSS
jgi:hypothetical protein